LQSQLIRSLDRNYITQDIFEKLDPLILLIGNKIGALIKHLNLAEIKGQKFLNRTDLKSTNTSTNNSKPPTPNKTINTQNAAKPLGAYPHARKVGNFLFLSGIGSRSAVDNKIPGLELDEEGNILKYDIAAETHQVMANVKAVLEASGSSWDKIVDVTVFLTNMKNDFPIYNKIYAEYFSEVQACRTTVEVKSLPTPIAIELKVIATIE
jgi:2-aminomuconate deaminase